jgi:hypothetical protein
MINTKPYSSAEFLDSVESIDAYLTEFHGKPLQERLHAWEIAESARHLHGLGPALSWGDLMIIRNSLVMAAAEYTKSAAVTHDPRYLVEAGRCNALADRTLVLQRVGFGTDVPYKRDLKHGLPPKEQP